MRAKDKNGERNVELEQKKKTVYDSEVRKMYMKNRNGLFLCHKIRTESLFVINTLVLLVKFLCFQHEQRAYQ